MHLRKDSSFVATAAYAVFLLATVLITRTSVATTHHGAVSTVEPSATEAGVTILRGGGNAIDAAVAVGLTLGVVDGQNSGIGGGCFMLIRRANGQFVAIDGRETAPAAASRDLFVRNGKADTNLSQNETLASGVPGALAAYEYAVNKFGKMKLRDLLLPAAELSEKGFKVSHAYAAVLASVQKEMESFEEAKAIYFKEGKPIGEGATLKQPDLAATYRSIANEGTGWFYPGVFAQATEKWMQAHHGMLSAKDFNNYRIKLREPIIGTYRDYTLAEVFHLSQLGERVQAFWRS